MQWSILSKPPPQYASVKLKTDKPQTYIQTKAYLQKHFISLRLTSATFILSSLLYLVSNQTRTWFLLQIRRRLLERTRVKGNTNKASFLGLVLQKPAYPRYLSPTCYQLIQFTLGFTVELSCKRGSGPASHRYRDMQTSSQCNADN